jgi:radical SAM superfamily enzyme YgiQ (UPF0313 family)
VKRFRLKLITLPWELEVPTLGLASLAAVTPPQFDIAIVDLLREHLHLDEPVDLVGISASTPRVKAAYALADLYRSKGVKVVLGGHHPTALPEEALEHADAVVCGEGEVAWKRLCEDFLIEPGRVQGLYRDVPADLATLPQPRVDLLHIERYGSYTYPIIASRGCPEVCTFCFAKKMTVGYRTYPIAHVLEQVRRRPAFTKACYFVDDNLCADADYSKELFAALAKTGIRFGMQARNEYALDSGNLERARAAGCVLISSGYESVNESTLKGTAKQADLQTYRECIANVFRAGMLPSGNWILGFDWDSPDIFTQTLEFLDSTDLMHCSFTTEIPFPGTAAFKKYRKEGRLLTLDYDDFVGKDKVVVRPAQMTPAQLTEGIRWLVREYYSVRRCAKRGAQALGNHNLPNFGPKVLKAPAYMGLNVYQWWQWHYRMVPSLQWLYQRLVSVNKYRYFSDLVRRTNFWSEPFEETGGEIPSSDFPFFSQQGFKRGRKSPMVVPATMRAPPPV